MPTKYILVGGYPHKALDGGKAFAEELVKGFEEPVKILECLFARSRDSWDVGFNQDREFITDKLPGKKLEFKLADPDEFKEQIRWADVIYLRGGVSETLLAELQRGKDDWKKELRGKTLGGSSAGADIISKYYYDLDHVKIGEGLGLLPLKMIVHYGSDYNAPNINWKKAETELADYKEVLPVIKLAEGQFEVSVQETRDF